MSKIKYAIMNSGKCIALVWETEKLGTVIVTQDKYIDFNCGFEICDIDASKTVKYVDLIDFLYESLPNNE